MKSGRVRFLVKGVLEELKRTNQSLPGNWLHEAVEHFTESLCPDPDTTNDLGIPVHTTLPVLAELFDSGNSRVRVALVG